MVAKTVNVPQGECARALTTTSASTASKMIMIIKMPTIATVPAVSPSSARIMSPNERPSRRVEAHSTMKSCTAPANTTPTSSQSVPGRYPICAASTGPTNGPRARARAGSTLRNPICYEELIAEGDPAFQWPDFDENSACGMCYTQRHHRQSEGRASIRTVPMCFTR